VATQEEPCRLTRALSGEPLRIDWDLLHRADGVYLGLSHGSYLRL